MESIPGSSEGKAEESAFILGPRNVLTKVSGAVVAWDCAMDGRRRESKGRGID